jgi:hypothetical protein
MLIIDALCRSRNVPVSLPLQSLIAALYAISQWYEEGNQRLWPMILPYRRQRSPDIVISISVVSTLVSVPISDDISIQKWRDESYFELVYKLESGSYRRGC